MSTKQRVVVAMSGGVDSSLAAALLLRQGYEVIGATMQVWEKDNSDIQYENERGCCSLSAVNDARNVADALGIPYYVLNFRDYFRETVIEYFIREYRDGRTPNPCIACNRYVKFDHFLKKSRELGADFVATGHYGIIRYDQEKRRYLLCKGIDASKDQSYALYHLTQDILRQFILPLGGYTKVEIRQMAREMGLKVAEKPDSQEICFVPNDDYKAYLRKKAPDTLKPGNIVDTQGRVVGRHEGLPLYTIGQRKGLGLAAGYPLYVVDILPERNEVVVGTNQQVFSDSLIAEDINFIAMESLKEPMEIEAKIRYSASPAKATIIPKETGRVEVVFKDPQRAVTPGQSVVFYKDEIVLGGGVIVRAGRMG